MFSSLARGISRASAFTRSSHRRDRTPDSQRIRRHDRYYDDVEDEDDEHRDEDEEEEDVLEEEQQHIEEDGAGEEDPLLPIFSSAHLDSLPVYATTHAVRALIIKRCETTLSWEQLRSPQISQFLVKPLQNMIRSSHFSRAVLYVLLANCLQFKREGQLNPGLVGICNTRAQIAELLAMRMLKDFSTRELIDALSYDFDPMSGMPQPAISFQGVAPNRRLAIARTSTLEVALRAEAKKFIAHPVVVRHLEAIWAGSIVFHSDADHLHRYPTRPRTNHDRHYGAMHSSMGVDGSRGITHNATPYPCHAPEVIRRSVTLYDPSKASLFKLSRLRVPRYRQFFSTLSYITMLALYLAVLSNRRLDITALEVVFWFWSLGFMLDELVGFSEQGFGLYIASVWNVIDIVILLLFFLYYMLRLTSVLMLGPDRESVAGMAYDLLAATAVPLFPRGFHLLDHYRYFSQLLIAFRLMVSDLIAVMVLIMISISGFFVAFTFSFGGDDFDGRGVAYAMFQLLMGFTPAAWDVWADFNTLGQLLLGLFLVMTHFLVVTILISVLTNSLMAIVKNANEEHQYLFAVNVISMVKSDMLFSFIAPTNLAGWIIAPLRYLMPLRQYVMLNRTLIKLTHFPILFTIFAFERMSVLRYSFEPVDHVERRGRTLHRIPTFALGDDAYGTRLRNPSAATYQDRALAEVFRRPFNDGSTTRKREPSIEERRKSVLDHWMSGLSGPGTPPVADATPAEGNATSRRRRGVARSVHSVDLPTRPWAGARSLFSDPEDEPHRLPLRPRQSEGSDLIDKSQDDKLADADDELEDDSLDPGAPEDYEGQEVTATIKFREPAPFGSLGSTVRARVLSSSPGQFLDSSPTQKSRKAMAHSRQASTNTIVFRPVSPEQSSASSRRSSLNKSKRRLGSRPMTAVKSSERSSPTFSPHRLYEQARPSMPSRQNGWNKSVPNLGSFLDAARNSSNVNVPGRAPRRTPSFDTMALDFASDIGDNRHIDNFMHGSFTTQMQSGMDAMRRQHRREDSDSGAISRMVLARMNKMEEGFKDILKEVKELKNPNSRGGSATETGFGSPSKRGGRARNSKTRGIAENGRERRSVADAIGRSSQSKELADDSLSAPANTTFDIPAGVDAAGSSSLA